MGLELLIDKLATPLEKLKADGASPMQPVSVPLTSGELATLIIALEATRAIRHLVR